MTEPCANRVDIYARTKQVASRGMANGVRAHSLVGQRWHFCLCLFRVPFNHRMDTETRYGMTATIQENAIGRRTIRDEWSERFHSCSPQRALTLLTAFSDDPDEQSSRVQVPNHQLGCFASACSRVVEK